MIKFKKILLIMGLIVSCGVKISASDIHILLTKQLKNAENLIDSIFTFFKEKLEHSIIHDYIKTSKQVGNNLINKDITQKFIRKAKENIGILNYRDVIEENKQLKENQSEILKDFQPNLNQNKSVVDSLVKENKQLKKKIITEQAEKTVIVAKLSESDEKLEETRKRISDYLKGLSERMENTQLTLAIVSTLCGVILIGSLIFNYFKKNTSKELKKPIRLR